MTSSEEAGSASIAGRHEWNGDPASQPLLTNAALPSLPYALCRFPRRRFQQMEWLQLAATLLRQPLQSLRDLLGLDAAVEPLRAIRWGAVHLKAACFLGHNDSAKAEQGSSTASLPNTDLPSSA